MSKHTRKVQPVEHSHQKSRWRSNLIIVSLVIASILIGAGIFYYRTYVEPFQKIVLTVDNQTIRRDYFLKRVRMAGGDPTLTLQQLAYEGVIKITAPQYGINISPADINEELNKEATAATANFQEWYTNQLITTELSDYEYREIVRTNLLATHLLESMAKDIPTTAEQVRVYTIVTAKAEDAANARTRITKGENFTAVAVQISLDAQTKPKGGELGWIPRGVTPFDDVIFPLAVGQVSDPVAIDPAYPDISQYAIFMVSEKDPDRVIDTGPLQILRSRALYSLILQQMPQHVKYSYTPADKAWVTEQLSKTP